MEVAGLSKILPPGISRWDKQRTMSLKGQQAQVFKTAVDAMALESAKAQHLRVGISTVGRILGTDHILYILADEKGSDRILGILKLGCKHLYVTNPAGMMAETDPLCVMDFYIHESMQRKGIGATFFKKVLELKGVQAYQLAYDRPSPRLLPFLAKAFGLKDYTPQHNHFVLYNQYFQDPSHLKNTKTRTVPAF